jgi:vancomycin resistance protein YoaR
MSSMQTVASPPESEQTSAFPPLLRPTLLIAGGLVVLLVVGVVVLRAMRSDVLPNVTLAGTDVGGMTRDELTAAVDDLADARMTELISVEVDGRRRSAANGAVGYEIDRTATVDAVWERGRQLNPLAAIGDHARATFGSIAVEPLDDVDDAAVRDWAQAVATAMAVPPREGTVVFAGAEVRRRDPEPGSRPAPVSLEDGARDAFTDPGNDTLDVTAEPVRPRTTTDDVDALVATARGLVSAPVRLERGDEVLTLEPGTIGDLYRVRRRDDGDGVRLTLEVKPTRLRKVIDADVRARFDTDPRDATVVLTSGGPTVRTGRRGFAVDMAAVREQIDELARGEGRAERSAEIAGETVRPDRTTKEARQLRVTQKVSSFTTEHACCEGRVTNIHRFADIMDGVLIEPGETFSLNGHVGPRTAATGFVAGGAIQQGEYVDEVGGGVSQFATTFFNATYFGGYEILDHKPHSYYISRYPVGRESTINYPTVDVEIRNNSPYGLLVDTSYTDTSITVTFWGRRWADVESTTGSPYNHTNPTTQIEKNPDLAEGTERVLQSGSQGFDVVVTRRITYREGGSETEEYFTRYLPEPRIVERGTKKVGKG